MGAESSLEDGGIVKVQNASPPDLHPISCILFATLCDGTRPSAMAGIQRIVESRNIDGKDLPHDNYINDLLGTVRPGCVSFSFWVSDLKFLKPNLLSRYFTRRQLFNCRAQLSKASGIAFKIKTKATVVVERVKFSFCTMTKH